MKLPAFRRRYRSRPHRPDERGVTIILVALSMVGILAMAALSIDVVTFYLARLEAQRASDAGALSAARIISLSSVTGDPNNVSGRWPTACTLATQVAQAVASQDTVSGAVASTVTVTFQYKGTTVDCSSPSSGFAVNPQVQVQVQRTSLPTFFARMWGAGSNNVAASATAEAYNPSGSGALLSTIVPVQPRCVKPWLVPNQDPLNSAGCTAGACNNFVNPASGSIQNPGISFDGTGATGVIGENFTLFPDCQRFISYCNLRDTTPIANRTVGGPPGGPIPATPNLEYLPAATANESTAVPSCSASPNLYEHAIEGCDQTTVYACGVQNANTADLAENPGVFTDDTFNGVQCLIHQNGGAGQDVLNSTVFPFQITAGDRNPLVAVQGDLISSSTSIVSLPIYDSNASPPPVFTSGGSTTVTIVGFLQVFITITPTSGRGDVNVTVLNVAGCGNGTSGSPAAAVTGSSPVPVRLITPP